MTAASPTYTVSRVSDESLRPWNPSEVLGQRRSPSRSRISAPSNGHAASVATRAQAYAPSYTPFVSSSASFNGHAGPVRPSSTGGWRALSLLLVLAATVLLSYAGWQAFGSDLYTSWLQSRMADPTPSIIVEDDPTVSPAFALASDWVAAPSGEVPALAPGSTLGTISIPKVGIDYKMVVGTGVEELKLGPGWMVGTSFPGQPGNAVVSGHRTTYGAPFNRIGELVPGDLIEVTTASGGLAVYEVRDSFIVSPEDSWVTAPTDGVRLTLTTCHPKGSARQRLIVQAELVSGAHTSKALSASDWLRSAPAS